MDDLRAQSSPRAGAGEITFTLPDPQRRLRGVRLEQELGLPAAGLDFRYRDQDGHWVLALPRPPVWRMEYRLRLQHTDGRVEVVNDPANGLRAPGAFGEKSVLRLPGYQVPEWTAACHQWPTAFDLRVPTRCGPVDVTVLSPPGPAERLLVAHDGPEYDRLAELGRFAAAVVRERRVPPFHLALAHPGSRDERYSANPEYGAALATLVLPALRAKLDIQTPLVLMGASLGALAALHAQRRYPRGIGGLFLQSGSFFVPQHDECESGFRYYQRILRAVAAVHAPAHVPVDAPMDAPVEAPVRASANGSAPSGATVPVSMTCGAAEENVHNNRLMAATLSAQGYAATLREVPDVHNFTAWRDAFDPHLVQLLRAVWGTPGA